MPTASRILARREGRPVPASGPDALAAAEWHAAAGEWLRRAAGYPPNRGLFTIAL